MENTLKLYTSELDGLLDLYVDYCHEDSVAPKADLGRAILLDFPYTFHHLVSADDAPRFAKYIALLRSLEGRSAQLPPVTPAINCKHIKSILEVSRLPVGKQKFDLKVIVVDVIVAATHFGRDMPSIKLFVVCDASGAVILALPKELADRGVAPADILVLEGFRTAEILGVLTVGATNHSSFHNVGRFYSPLNLVGVEKT